MHYYEVLIADSRYHSSAPLVYSAKDLIPNMSVVSVPLKNKAVTGFVTAEVSKPPFTTKPIKTLLSQKQLPFHCLELAHWLKEYYSCTLGEALKQLAPSSPVIKRSKVEPDEIIVDQSAIDLDAPLNAEQKAAIAAIENHPSTTVLLHGDTGSGKTRVYLELAKDTLRKGRSVVILTPEIALTAQLKAIISRKISSPVFVLHSELPASQRKKLWFEILESTEPIVIVGPRSALFAPIASLGLIVVDEAHEPAYKQEQAPRYHTSRVASQLGVITASRVVLGSATPLVTDYYLASSHSAIVEMKHQAVSGQPANVATELIDIRRRENFLRSPYLSNAMIDAVNTALQAGKQSIIYYNLRGSARIVICDSCGWELICPNCDVPMVYHGDEHLARCHICGRNQRPPKVCPVCANNDIIYKAIGTKALFDIVQKLFSGAKVRRYDSDNLVGERLNETFDDLHGGEIDILVGTQLIAKGLDLPRLGLVGIISAETSLTLPDYTAQERTFQLLYQVIGRVGRGHTEGKVVMQSYEPDSIIIQAALGRDWAAFYEHAINERRQFRYPPFSYLLKVVCKRLTLHGAQTAAQHLKELFVAAGLPVEIIGPTPSFYQRRGKYYYYQLVAKSKDRKHLQQLAALVPAGWTIDLDPQDLL